VGDVGGTNEEITYVPAAQSRGANLGWNCWSGMTHVISTCDPANYFAPTYDYPSGPDVVIGGYVVRDPALPSFTGQYLFGRFDTGIVMKLGPHAAPPAVDTGLNIANVSGFGEDGVGHLYASSLGGEVYRLGESGGTLTKTSIGSFDQPVAVAGVPGDPNQLFIVEKPGRIQRWTPSGTTEFLDISSRVLTADVEEGLLALAVSPDYATSHKVFVFYVDDGSDLQVDQYRDGVRTPVATIQHDQASNHNGGQLLFGPDGALYLSTGDGGTQGEPELAARQDPEVRRGNTPATPGGHHRARGLAARAAATARAAPRRRGGLRALQRGLHRRRGRDAADRRAQAAPEARHRNGAELTAHPVQGSSQGALRADASAGARPRRAAACAGPGSRPRRGRQQLSPDPPLAARAPLGAAPGNAAKQAGAPNGSFVRMWGVAELEVIAADVTALEVDAIANAANTQLAHGGGVARAISRAGGPEVQRESSERAPIGLGEAVETTAGDMPARWVIHAATMELGGPTSADIIERATRSTLAKAEELGARSLALVAFGTGVGGFPLEEAARIMVGAAREHSGGLERIVFALHGDDAERAFREAL
jgi:O-acetyl-ADP-ribose deacetylase (regulator of RNase III)